MRTKKTLPTALILALCMLIPAASAAEDDNHPPKAFVYLSGSKASLTQTSDTAWTLAKTGAGNTTSTVTWTITATQGATVGGHLVADAFIAVTNIGSGGATIGNIVVNLQTNVNGKWVTQSSDIADATHGDAATTVQIVARTTSENLGRSYSGGAITSTPWNNYLRLWNSTRTSRLPT